jgi:hypothetical protein
MTVTQQKVFRKQEPRPNEQLGQALTHMYLSVYFGGKNNWGRITYCNDKSTKLMDMIMI